MAYSSETDDKKPESKKSDKDALTIDRAFSDFRGAYQAKSKLVERELEDHRFALGEQWSSEDLGKLKEAGIKPVTDNRIAPNIFLLTGLERQNRAEPKAFPIGEEDGVKAEIATLLFKDALRKSDYGYESSDQFKDGITCGEKHLELYLDNTDSLLNGRPCWHQVDGASLFPDPLFRKYDLSDASYVYKLKLDVSKDDLISLFPDAEDDIEKLESGKLDVKMLLKSGVHVQKRDYPKDGQTTGLHYRDEKAEGKCFDLIERYYYKFVKKVFIGDLETGEMTEQVDLETAKKVVADYIASIDSDIALYLDAEAKAKEQAQLTGQQVPLPPAPPERDPERYRVIQRNIKEIWCFAFVPGMDKPLADARAWFYPKWKKYPFVPFFARFSTAPLTGDDRHLLIQGVVHGVKGAQEKHNKAEMLMLRHLNSSAHSGWLSEEDVWVDPDMVKKFGTAAGVNLEYRAGRQMPQRIQPAPLSQAHAQMAVESAESIKAQLGINADLLAANEGGGDSGRAIALRQKQGLLMVQELYDNLTRSRIIAGRFLLSQLGEIYDTETAMKILGDAYLKKTFPAPMKLDPNNPEAEPQPIKDKFGKPMIYDKELAELAIAEVLQGDLGEYDVNVGESVASDTQRVANAAELAEFDKTHPGLIPPDVIIKNSQLPETAKKDILEAIARAQQLAAAQPPNSNPQQPKTGPKESK